MSTAFAYDVFLSHNAQDKPRVRKLAERLKAAGLRVWFDEWVIQAGDIIALKVDEGLEQSRVLLLCISSAALASGWVAQERYTAVHRDPANVGRRFIPLLLGDCELPDTLRRYKYVDFREEGGAALNEVLDACGYQGACEYQVEAALLPPTAVVAQPAAMPPLEELQQACATASEALLAWPTRIDGERIESPAFEQLVESRTPEQPNVQLLLGEPGSGKSALLAQLGGRFREDGCLVLAIKGDLLSQPVDSVAKLGLHLGLGAMPSLALRRLAETAPVVVLVDQLDALADLVDLHGGRLNALLQLIRELDGVENLRVIASSREVEHRHDTRLAAIDAEAVQLPLLPWEEVQALLERRGILARDWPETFREILRRPQQLVVFVKLVSSGQEMPVFTSYQQMLEKLWDQCVTNAGGLPGRADLLRDLARRMAADETLWLARARFDDRAPQVKQLIAAGILTTAEDERRLGFQHQTVFDFALARSFADEGQTLCDFVLERQQSLFVRPRLWSALVYLRGAEPSTYRREFAALWQRIDLRLHVRLQLVEFLGQLEDPDQREEDYMRTALADAALRSTGLIAIVGRRIWFERLAPDLLPRLMSEGQALEGAIARVLNGAAKQSAQTVIGLLRDHWIPHSNMDWPTIHVLRRIHPWVAEATPLAEVLAARDSTSSILLFDLISSAVETDAVSAMSIAAAFLESKVAAVEALSDATEAEDNEDPAAFLWSDSPRQRAANVLLQGDTGLGDIKPIAEAAPAVFIEDIWPLFLRLLRAVGYRDDATDDSFRIEYGLGLSVRDVTAHLLEAIEIAVETLARTDSARFEVFLAASEQINSMTVQRILAHGLAGAAAQKPLLALNFLLSDPRRFKLGDYDCEHRDSGKLISALSPNLNQEQNRTLEVAITEWQSVSVPQSEIDFEEHERSTRQGRLMLLRYIPHEFRSPEAAAFIAAEEAAFPSLTQRDGISVIRTVSRSIGSPMSTDVMEQASDDAILATLADLPDSTGWENPRDSFEGGSVQVSQAFAELAKRQPDRAIELINRLDPEEHTRPAALALEKLSDSDVSSERLFAFVHALNARGFTNTEFRICAARAITKRLKEGVPLPDDLFSMFNQWLPEIAADTLGDESEDADQDGERSILWESGYSWMVPHGSFEVLNVLNLACRVAHQPGRFLSVIQSHLQRPENAVTWRAVCWHLDLRSADCNESAAFLEELFRRFPQVRDSVAGCRAVVEAFQWLPSESVRTILEDVRGSGWQLSGRAFGELLMYRHVFWNDDWASATVEQLLADSATTQEMLTGFATTAVHVFGNASARNKAVGALQAIIPRANQTTAREVLGLFSMLPRLDQDPEILEILNVLIAHPNALVPDALESLVSRLADLVPVHSVLVANLADTILDHHGQTLLDIRTGFAACSGEFINLALTLHRDDGPGRERGLTLFERLLSLNVDGARQSLFAVDARPVVDAESPRRPRRRRGVRRRR